MDVHEWLPLVLPLVWVAEVLLRDESLLWKCAFKGTRCTYCYAPPSPPILQCTTAFKIFEWQQSCGFQLGEAASYETLCELLIQEVYGSRLLSLCGAAPFERHVGAEFTERIAVPAVKPKDRRKCASGFVVSLKHAGVLLPAE